MNNISQIKKLTAPDYYTIEIARTKLEIVEITVNPVGKNNGPDKDPVTITGQYKLTFFPDSKNLLKITLL